MSEEEEIVIQPPKKVLGLTLTADPLPSWRKWSTWCGWVAAGCIGAFGFYVFAPPRAQALVPDWLLITIMVLGMGSGFAVAVATKIRQPKP